MSAVALVTSLAAAALLTFTAVASADPTGDPSDPVPSQQQVDEAQAVVRSKTKDVATIRAALTSAGSRLEDAAIRAEIASERFNGARWRLMEARKASVRAERAARRSAQRVESQRVGIASLVTQTYRDGSVLIGVTAFLGDGGPTSVMRRIGVAQSAGQSMNAKYDAFERLSDAAKKARVRADRAEEAQQDLMVEAERARATATAAAASAQSEAASIAATKDQLIAQLARAQNLSVNLVRRREDARDAAAQEAAAAQQSTTVVPAAEPGSDPAPAPAPAPDPAPAPAPAPDPAPDPAPAPAPDPEPAPAPPPGGGAGSAISFAKAQLGEPYQWGAAGPDSWDCSGLTMRAWQAGGKSLPHYSVAQYSVSHPIGVGDLRPGDLVFWGSSPGSIHHVAMYIGDGRIIHAPRTGQPVQIASMYYWVPPDYFARP